MRTSSKITDDRGKPQELQRRRSRSSFQTRATPRSVLRCMAHRASLSSSPWNREAPNLKSAAESRGSSCYSKASHYAESALTVRFLFVPGFFVFSCACCSRWIRSSNTEAGSSLGSCSTSSPRKALARMERSI
jgi:hypothetical protein